jgi:hypothetical protein
METGHFTRAAQKYLKPSIPSRTRSGQIRLREREKLSLEQCQDSLETFREYMTRSEPTECETWIQSLPRGEILSRQNGSTGSPLVTLCRPTEDVRFGCLKFHRQFPIKAGQQMLNSLFLWAIGRLTKTLPTAFSSDIPIYPL